MVFVVFMYCDSWWDLRTNESTPKRHIRMRLVGLEACLGRGRWVIFVNPYRLYLEITQTETQHSHICSCFEYIPTCILGLQPEWAEAIIV